MPLLLVLLFAIVPIAELAIILQVGRAIGTWPTVGLLLVDSLVGAALLRVQGRAAWRRLAEALRSGRPPAREILDGALILIGATLLLTPGFATDVAGLLLLLPPTRALVRRVLAKRLAHRMLAAMATPAMPGGWPPTGARPHGAPATNGSRAQQPHHGPDIEGSATDIDPRLRN